MAVVLNILSEFDGKGISKARKEFSQLEGAGKKAGFALKKAMVPATAALAGLGALLVSATKDAMEDEAAQTLLATTIRKTTKATDAQIKANEDWISTQGKLLGVSDDELRPVLGRLVKATGSVTKAQKLATQAMDIAASTGKPLATVTAAIEKAYGGNLAALGKLAPEYRTMIKDGASFEEVMAKIAETTGGAATVAANTNSGKMKRLSLAMKETKESIGTALIPVFEKLLPYLQKFADWAEKNPGKITAIAIAFGVLSAAVVIMNAAMALNPVGLIVIAILALIALLVVAYKKFEGFRNVVDTVFGFIKKGIGYLVDTFKTQFDIMYGLFKTIFNGIAKQWNNTIGKLSFSIPSWVPVIGGAKFEVPDMPYLANGGIVTGPTVAMIGERGPEAVIPLDRTKDFGMGGGINITVQTGVGDPVAIGKAVSDVLVAYNRRTGVKAA
jgi:hypothetical protein